MSSVRTDIPRSSCARPKAVSSTATLIRFGRPSEHLNFFIFPLLLSFFSTNAAWGRPLERSARTPLWPFTARCRADQSSNLILISLHALHSGLSARRHGCSQRRRRISCARAMSSSVGPARNAAHATRNPQGRHLIRCRLRACRRRPSLGRRSGPCAERCFRRRSLEKK
jgi:hypothetical protein